MVGLSSEPRSIVVFDNLHTAVAGGANGDIYVWDYVNSILTTHTGIHTNRVSYHYKYNLDQ